MKHTIFISLIFLLLVAPLHAAESGELYQAEVEVPNQGASARSAGMRQAMAEVLAKVSGSDRVMENEGLVKAIDSASHYVQQFRYYSGSAGGDTGGDRLMLSVRFDQNGIDELLQRHASSYLGGGLDTMVLEVVGVESLKQYRRVVGYLSAMREVSAVKVDRMTADTVRLSLQIKGNSQALHHSISRGGVLAAAPRYRQTYPGAAQRAPGMSGGQSVPVEAGPPVTTYHLLP